MKKSSFHTYDFNFGIIIPRQTGIHWEQQTQGVACHHVSIEGVYIPLKEPYEHNVWDAVFHADTERTITGRLAQANYNFDEKEIKYLWDLLEKRLAETEGLEFEKVDAPAGQPENQEGIQWIKIKRWTDGSISYHNELIGEVVCLVYPNSD